MKSTFQVSICGGGIGGLMLALVIGKYGTLPVEIFEAGPTITTVGAGIVFFGRTVDVMSELGLYDELVKIAIGAPKENSGPVFRKSDQPDGYHWFSKELKRGSLTVHRKDAVDLLLRHLPASCKIHASKRLEYYDICPEVGKIKLHFTDGSIAVTDVLVGADGIHSSTRKTMYQNLASLIRDDGSRNKLLEYVDPVWTGTLVYRNLVPAAKFEKEYPDVETPTDVTLHLGKNTHIVTYPISQGQLLNVVIFRYSSAFGTPFEGQWVMDVPEQEIVDQFEGWEIRARALAKCMERPSRWALHCLRPLPHYVDGRVALLGDAVSSIQFVVDLLWLKSSYAHAMEPHFGAGAGQAMEDAYVLGRLLTHELTHGGNVTEALNIYEEVRLPFANNVVQQSQDIGRYYALRVSLDDSVRASSGPEELEYVRRSIEDAWEWQNESELGWDDAEERWRAQCGTRVKL